MKRWIGCVLVATLVSQEVLANDGDREALFVFRDANGEEQKTNEPSAVRYARFGQADTGDLQKRRYTTF